MPAATPAPSTGPVGTRPPFPSGWARMGLTLDDCNLANVLPVGQSFLWHRHQLYSPVSEAPSTAVKLEDDVKNGGPSTASNTAEDSKEAAYGITEEFSRAVDNPPRVILLRQSPAEHAVYYTSVAPADPPTHSDKVDGAGQLAYPRQTVDEAWLNDYLQLHRVEDLPNLYASWIGSDPDLFARTLGENEADRLWAMRMGDYSGIASVGSQRGRGIRVLQQDPWECLTAFITSTNNHIPRIAGLMHRLSSHFSPPLLSLPTPGSLPRPPSDPSADPAEGGDSALHDPTPLTTYHLFPPAHALAPVGQEAALEPTLRELGFGYRAGFIASSLRTLRDRFGTAEGDVEAGLMGLRSDHFEAKDRELEVREVLLELKGIGRKVADCVMLMCLGQDHIIPIDTHVAAIAARHPSFPSRLKNKPMSPALYDEVQQFLAAKWGEMGGWAQAVMFALDLPDTTVSKGAKGTASPSLSRTGSATTTPIKGKLKRVDSTPSKVKQEAAEGSPLAGKRKTLAKGNGATGGNIKTGTEEPNDKRPGVKRTRSSARLLARGLADV